MKKISVIAVMAMVAGVVSADLQVNWKNDDAPIFVDAGFTTGSAGNEVIMLIWSTTATLPSGDDSVDLDGLAFDGSEIMLASDVTGAFGLWGPLGSQAWGDADVGGADINAGYMYTRVFNGDSLAGDMKYLNFAATIYDTSTKDYDPALSPPDPLAEFTGSAGAGVAAATWTAESGTVAIPEPGTVGLFGVAGIGMFLARRKARR